MSNINERKQEVLQKYKLFEELLNRNGETVAYVCRKTGLEASTFSHWKAGQYVPGTEKMLAICKHFGVPIQYFYKES